MVITLYALIFKRVVLSMKNTEQNPPYNRDVVKKGENILRELVLRSRGMIEYAMVVSPEGLSLFQYLPREYDPDSLSAATIAMIGALTSALGILGKSGYIRLDVALDDGSHLIISPLGDYALVVSTAKSPNLGFVYFIVENFSSRLVRFIKINLKI